MPVPGQGEFKPPRFVYFDLDGTLCDTVAAIDAALTVALKTACRWLGKDEQRVPAYARGFWREYSHYVQVASTVEPVPVLKAVLERTLPLNRLDCPESRAEELARIGMEQFRRWLRPFSQLPELLTWLQQREIGCGVISNGAGLEQRSKLAGLKIADYFSPEHLLFSDELGLAKPDPAIFNRALEVCGFQASETIFIGDSPLTDLPGALEVGLTVIWLNRHGLRAPELDPLPGRLWEVKSFSAVVEIVKKLVDGR